MILPHFVVVVNFNLPLLIINPGGVVIIHILQTCTSSSSVESESSPYDKNIINNNKNKNKNSTVVI